ncbi:MAG: hypothetical protein JOS17DRAFT_749452 [Linnemannia elongata]|nr:MAG: hypothetical protein JOS17DRAFT_749452 [Linnemannia elongata]
MTMMPQLLLDLPGLTTCINTFSFPTFLIYHYQQQQPQATQSNPKQPKATPSNTPSSSSSSQAKARTASHVPLQVQQEPVSLCCRLASPDPSVFSRSPASCSSQDDPRPGPRAGSPQVGADYARQLQPCVKAVPTPGPQGHKDGLPQGLSYPYTLHFFTTSHSCIFNTVI